MSRWNPVADTAALKSAIEGQGRGGDSAGFFRPRPPEKKSKTPNEYVIRIIPPIDPNRSLPWEKFVRHFFTSRISNNKVTFVCSRTARITGEENSYKCPVCDYASSMYDKAEKTGDKGYRDVAGEVKGSDAYIMPIVVKEDSTDLKFKPKPMVWTFGKQVFEEITRLLNSRNIGNIIIDPTNRGCDLILTVSNNEGGFPSYHLAAARDLTSVNQVPAGKDPISEDDVFDYAEKFDYRKLRGDIVGQAEANKILNRDILANEDLAGLPEDTGSSFRNRKPEPGFAAQPNERPAYQRQAQAVVDPVAQILPEASYNRGVASPQASYEAPKTATEVSVPSMISGESMTDEQILAMLQKGG
jgi:gp32 DNA binding protein like